MSLYPNPAKNIIIIEIRLTEYPNKAKIQIINPVGVVINEIPIIHQNDYIVIPLFEYTSGLYFCKLNNGNSLIETKKLIISRF